MTWVSYFLAWAILITGTVAGVRVLAGIAGRRDRRRGGRR